MDISDIPHNLKNIESAIRRADLISSGYLASELHECSVCALIYTNQNELEAHLQTHIDDERDIKPELNSALTFSASNELQEIVRSPAVDEYFINIVPELELKQEFLNGTGLKRKTNDYGTEGGKMERRGADRLAASGCRAALWVS